MSLTEQNHTTDTNRQQDDELQHSLLHNKVNHSAYGKQGESCLVFGVIQPTLFFLQQKETICFFPLDSSTVLEEKSGAQCSQRT